MRRSASPSKAAMGSAPSTAKRARQDPSSAAVLRTPFKPLTGLDTRRASASADKPQAQRQHPAAPSCSSAVAREIRTRSIAELEQDIADMQLILHDKLASHNAARRAQNLPEHNPQDVVAQYIALLTQYNKVKDAAQLVFDKIAEIEQLPAKEIHARYGVADAES